MHGPSLEISGVLCHPSSVQTFHFQHNHCDPPPVRQNTKSSVKLKV